MSKWDLVTLDVHSVAPSLDARALVFPASAFPFRLHLVWGRSHLWRRSIAEITTIAADAITVSTGCPYLSANLAPIPPEIIRAIEFHFTFSLN
jgi:hypothetical protein